MENIKKLVDIIGGGAMADTTINRLSLQSLVGKGYA